MCVCARACVHVCVRVQLKLPKKAKKGKANLKKDKTTNVDTEVYKKWISDPESVKDICRAPRPVAKSRLEAKGRRYHKVFVSCVCVCVSGVCFCLCFCFCL